MPAAYAHHKFGQMCLESMPSKLSEVCRQYRELYDIGVHGPDILFYYNPLSSNQVNRYGQALHQWTGEEFFQSTKSVYQEHPKNRKAMMAYLLGFLAHFILDAGCHDFINEEAEESELSHNLIESRYEVYLMELDGKDPLKVDRSLPLHPTPGNAAVIAEFFPFEQGEILKALRGQKKVLHVFYSPKEVKKKTLRKAISLIGVQGDFGDLFLDENPDIRGDMRNEIIFARQKAAAELYPKLAKNLVRFLYDKCDLEEYFSYNFEGEVQDHN